MKVGVEGVVCEGGCRKDCVWMLAQGRVVCESGCVERIVCGCGCRSSMGM